MEGAGCTHPLAWGKPDSQGSHVLSLSGAVQPAPQPGLVRLSSRALPQVPMPPPLCSAGWPFCPQAAHTNSAIPGPGFGSQGKAPGRSPQSKGPASAHLYCCLAGRRCIPESRNKGGRSSYQGASGQRVPLPLIPWAQCPTRLHCNLSTASANLPGPAEAPPVKAPPVKALPVFLAGSPHRGIRTPPPRHHPWQRAPTPPLVPGGVATPPVAPVPCQSPCWSAGPLASAPPTPYLLTAEPTGKALLSWHRTQPPASPASLATAWMAARNPRS